MYGVHEAYYSYPLIVGITYCKVEVLLINIIMPVYHYYHFGASWPVILYVSHFVWESFQLTTALLNDPVLQLRYVTRFPIILISSPHCVVRWLFTR